MDQTKLERAYRTFVHCHHVVGTATSEPALLADVCSVAVGDLGFVLAWIGFVSDADHVVRPAAQAGYEAGYLESIRITWSDDEHGGGPTGRAIRERAPQIARNLADDAQYAPWRADALRRGYASSAAIPLFDSGRCFGALNLYASEPDAFDDDEIALLEEMAVDLVLGIVRLRSTRKLEELSARAERAANAETAGVVAAAVTHDLNNLLQIVELSIASAQYTTSREACNAALADAAAATTNAVAMMKHLLSLHRRALESTGHTDVDQVVRGMRPLLARLAPHAVLDLRLGAEGARARIGAIDLERILINLAVNAAHAMPSGGALSISTAQAAVASGDAHGTRDRLEPGEYVVLTFADTGHGIGADVLPRIFDPYFTTKGESGTGLGLPSVLQIARAAGGSVSVASPAGGGARFSIFLPTRS